MAECAHPLLGRAVRTELMAIELASRGPWNHQRGDRNRIVTADDGAEIAAGGELVVEAAVDDDEGLALAGRHAQLLRGLRPVGQELGVACAHGFAAGWLPLLELGSSARARAVGAL